ncbi:Uma2 family endonuclease [Streptomyces sp. NPDC002055]|uniref:Uma2 family endonuclease n=1 Tax=Streptomyces sp. NPDC002055 TaxID=3154534 RepID=UPI0033182AC1
MTVELTDRIEMADSEELTLDELFERLEHMPVPEGYKVEIVEGTVHMSPQRRTHWKIIRRVLRQLEDHFGGDAEIDSDVRIDFPGHLNGFAPDLAKAVEGATPDDKGRFAPRDLEFVLEVISRGTGASDYGGKKAVYAESEVPVYLIADPYQRKCHLFTHPKGGEYRSELTVTFGEPVDLTGTSLGLVLSTEDFPRD